jgi:hypothetical protein
MAKDPSDDKLIAQAKAAASANKASAAKSAATTKTTNTNTLSGIAAASGTPAPVTKPMVTMGANTSGLFVGPIPTGTVRTATGYSSPESLGLSDSANTARNAAAAAAKAAADKEAADKLAAEKAAKDAEAASLASLIASITAGFQAQIDALTSQLKNTVTSLGQVTRRKPNGVVEVYSLLSDNTEKLIDTYTDFSARDSVMKMFENTGLEKTFMNSLLATIDNVYLENVAPTDAQVLNSIYNSDAYKTRFAANEVIRKRMSDGTGMAGDRILNPAEYIAVEEGYRSIMQNAGLPAGFYDNPNDFTKLISSKIDAAELKSRVNIAADALQKADQNTKDALRSYYGLSDQDMVAYLLDSDKAFKLIEGRQAFTLSTADAEKQYGSAQIGGAALRAGQEASKGLSEEIYAAGKGKEAEDAFQSAAQQQQAYERLVGLSGGASGKEDLVRAQLSLEGGAGIAKQAKELASKERARFQQRSAIKKESLQRSGANPDV